MKIQWSKLYSNIPTRVTTASKKFFEVLWADTLFDTTGTKTYGRTEFEPNRIILNRDQTEKDAVLTLVHEAFHAWDHEKEIGLTEKQVMLLEKCYPQIRELVLKLEGKK